MVSKGCLVPPKGEVSREWGSLSLWEVSQEIGPATEQFKRGQTCLGVWCGANASERQRKEVDLRQPQFLGKLGQVPLDDAVYPLYFA